MTEDPQRDRARWWRRRVVGSGALLVLIAAALVFSLVATDPGDNVTLVETGVEVRGPERFVTGALRNTTDDPYSRIRIEISLLAEDGEVVETVTAMILNLAADETRRFEAAVLADEAVRYRVDGLTCDRTPGSAEAEAKPSCSIPPERNKPPFAGDL